MTGQPPTVGPNLGAAPARGRRRWWLHRSEWAIRLMRLPVSGDPPNAPGLLMIQIDGLGRGEAEKALAAGRLPTLARLIARDGYRLHDLYAGLPSSTPAVQGELFYGRRTAVPAFSYVERETGEERRMYDPAAAGAVEDRLQAEAEGLLAGGSAYSDIYAGGAQEAHFCAASLGFSDLVKSADPWSFFAFLLSNLVAFLRTAALAAIEAGLAAADAVRGVIRLGELWHELKFVPTRVAIAILMRDLITVGAGIDLVRGLPVVHVNYLGYDEQAHRRGPASGFAHWSLRGIDGAVGRLVRAARRSPRRHYRVWVYSDHGQEAVTPYAELAGRSIEAAVEAVFARHGRSALAEAAAGIPATASADGSGRGEQAWRAAYLGGDRLQRAMPRFPAAGAGGRVRLAAMGPVGHVYPDGDLSPAQREALGMALAVEARVPMVLAAGTAGEATVWTPAGGRHGLPEAASAVLGAEHPHLDAAAVDLVALAHHPDAGAFVLIGWSPDPAVPAVSFPFEHGAHAGPGPSELTGFALLPPDDAVDGAVLRPADLRQKALSRLHRPS